MCFRIRWRSCFSSAWNPRVSRVFVVAFMGTVCASCSLYDPLFYKTGQGRIEVPGKRQYGMPVTDEDQDRVERLLMLDILATIGRASV